MEQTVFGIVRDAVIIPRMSTRTNKFSPYVLLVIATNGAIQKQVVNAAFFKTLVEPEISVPDIEYGDDKARITDIIGKGLQLTVENTVKGKTKYTDKEGNEFTHGSTGTAVRNLFVLSDTEASAYMYQNMMSAGVSTAAVEIAAKSSTQLLIEKMRARDERIAAKTPSNSNTSRFTQPVDETDEGDDHTDDDSGSDPDVDLVLDQVTESAKSAKPAKTTK